MNNKFGKINLSKMKIKINGIDLQQYYQEKFGTKFKVGDKVHIIESIEGENGVKWIYSGKAEIKEININITKYSLLKQYKIEHLCIFENDLFKTEKQARKECKRRNNGK